MVIFTSLNDITFKEKCIQLFLIIKNIICTNESALVGWITFQLSIYRRAISSTLILMVFNEIKVASLIKDSSLSYHILLFNIYYKHSTLSKITATNYITSHDRKKFYLKRKKNRRRYYFIILLNAAL
ncbi:hypothetical protein BpHYR1_047484 [Brachionus plicatilis]|uniref:Uncharacterized protein n=1 Tax=Brachionus plicatilis TaxID=10195 RepID=A0A3M7QEG3_BRAPC|nr:hypothetical protein BpHYR1_047484 [Brachionus plicatilis]